MTFDCDIADPWTNTANSKLVCQVAEATPTDVDTAVRAAQAAFSAWGFSTTGAKRSELMHNLANLMAQHQDELAALEALDNGMCVVHVGGLL
jgi:aldehyde dehydrogenase (NAD+)